MRSVSKQDSLLATLAEGLLSLYQMPSAQRTNPATAKKETTPLNLNERKNSAGLMLVNHSGEICAQALYHGQALMARQKEVHDALQHAANEEGDHLNWTATRLQELDSNTSKLNALWYSGSFLFGLLAGAAGDRWSLGFIAETERQVVTHLNSHLKKLPEQDVKSRAIVEQMRDDEGAHATTAIEAGGAELPAPIPSMMRCTAKIMTTVSYWI